jgi:acyl-coenzyme A synthetase/AMP-(fatty) acid ligase
MYLNFLIDRFKQVKNKTAFIYEDRAVSYKDLLAKIEEFKYFLKAHNLSRTVLAIDSNNSPEAIALLLASIENSNISIPFSSTFEDKKDDYFKLAGVKQAIKFDDNRPTIVNYSYSIDSVHYSYLFENKRPGLVLFSSGTSGKSKGIVHNLSALLDKYQRVGKDYITLSFMNYDHIGGFDTILYSLSNQSTLVFQNDRSPKSVCDTIEKHKIEVLPVTPTFLNLLLLSETYKDYNLSSLKYITYGAEPMPEYLLKKCNNIFPNVKFLQKFGTSETGTLQSKSKANDSLWFKIGGDGFDIRIVEGILQIKAKSAMLGYLNAPHPFTEDGWYITGDKVETDGEYIRILGRDSEIINVGGEKVFPAEVENVILELDEVKDVLIYGENSPIMGNIVVADVVLTDGDIKKSEAKKLIKKHCFGKLEQFKIPVKINISSQAQYTDRFKKIRSNKND